MKKERISQVAALPTPSEILHGVTIANNQTPSARNERKRETKKGTILQSVMIDKELLKKVKRKAFDNEKTISDVINEALKTMFQ